MAFEAILREADQLHNVSTRLEALAEQYLPVSEPLMTIAGSVRNAATLLEVLVVSKVQSRSELRKKTRCSKIVEKCLILSSLRTLLSYMLRSGSHQQNQR